MSGAVEYIDLTPDPVALKRYGAALTSEDADRADGLRWKLERALKYGYAVDDAITPATMADFLRRVMGNIGVVAVTCGQEAADEDRIRALTLYDERHAAI